MAEAAHLRSPQSPVWDVLAAGLVIPYLAEIGIAPPDGTNAVWSAATMALITGCFALATVALALVSRKHMPLWARLIILCFTIIAAGAPIYGLISQGAGSATPLMWLYVAGYTVLFWRCLAMLAARDLPRLISRGVVAAVFGVALIWYWEVVVVGFDIPHALLPAPSDVGTVLAAEADVLWGDFVVTFFLSALPGFAIGGCAGFLFAIVVDGRPFLARGLLPLGSAFSAIPIVAVAPIMIMWFGSGPESKAAVVILMTFFPMMVNTLGGLNTVDRMELDLMHSYGAGYWTRLFKLRLPTALPFIFNALKINATLAMIGAIVSEFFGSPLAGMGFRISAMIGRLNLEMVWSTIAVAAVAGSLFYGVWAILERIFTFWHPTQQR